MRTPKQFSNLSPFRRKAFRFSVCAAVAAAALLATSCGRLSPPPPAGTDAADIAPAAVSAAIARHLADAVAPDYGGDWEHAIPLVRIVATDATDPADIRAWGDFEVWNYHFDGETLLCVSGGSHPGLFHLRGTDGSLAVTAFDPVPDGADFLPGAKKVFGKHFAAWRELVSDDAARGEARRNSVADYVSAHGLPAKFFQDYGWDPVPLP
jgi:hypothetical protein